MTTVENLRTHRRTSCFGARHNATPLATEATPYATLARQNANDHTVRFPIREIRSLLESINMTTIATKLNTAISGHNLIQRSAGRRRFLLSPPSSQNGA